MSGLLRVKSPFGELTNSALRPLSACSIQSSVEELDAENMPPGTPLLHSPECSAITPPLPVGPGGDNNAPVKDDGLIKPFKKKTRGTRGGKKNREKKLRAQGINRTKMRLENDLAERNPIKSLLRSKTENALAKSNVTNISYSAEEIILLRSLMFSKKPPMNITKIERESKNCPPVEIFPVVYLPEDGSSPKKGELTEKKLIDKIDEICTEIVDTETTKQYRVHGIEPHWANSRFKSKTEPRTNSSCSSNMSTPRGQSSDSGCPSSNMTTPREEELLQINKEPETKIEEEKPLEEEKPETTTTTTVSEEETTATPKHPMRPPKNFVPSSFQNKFQKFTFDHEASPLIYGMPYTWYDPVQPMLVPMPIDPRYYTMRGVSDSKRPVYMPVYMPYPTSPLATPSPTPSRRASST